MSRASNLSVLGRFGTYLMTPPSELAPYRVPWGPRSTSTRAMSNVSKSPDDDRGVGQAGARSERHVVEVDADRRRDAAGVDAAQGDAGGRPAGRWSTLKPGTSGTRSWKSSARCCSSSWPPTTVTEAGISATASVRFWAVTTTSSRKSGGFDGSSGGWSAAGWTAASLVSADGGASWAQASVAASKPSGRGRSFSKDA